jgi:serine/threonine protein kinase
MVLLICRKHSGEGLPMEALHAGDPERIGRYLLSGRLGAGGMGQVFLGRSPGGLQVAIKVIHQQLAGDPKFRTRFRREVNAARAVSGVYTAAVVDSDAEGSQPWLATAFLPGLTLQDAVGTYGPLPPEAVRRLGAGLAEALISIHQAGVVHRDLKPSNIMLTPQGPRVIDFGIARAADGSTASQTGLGLGSPGYITPEQITGSSSGPAGDVFSLGVVLAYAATAANPFGEGPPHVLLYRIVHDPPRLDALCDPALREMVAACLNKEPGERPGPEQVLDRLAGGEGPTGADWLPQQVAEAITQRVTQQTKVLPEPPERALAYGIPVSQGVAPSSAVPGPAARTSTPPAAPGTEEPPEEPLPPLRRRLVPLFAGIVVVAALVGVTHPALWSDGEVCVALRTTAPAVRLEVPSLPSMDDLTAGLEALKKAEAKAREAQQQARQEENERIKALAERAETPALKSALAELAELSLRPPPEYSPDNAASYPTQLNRHFDLIDQARRKVAASCG